jgi:TRAP-type mannitol/chloroaromatic compound transport system permease small subunit
MAFVRVIERISLAFGIVAMAQVMCLVGFMVYEVFCRFGLNAPNIWAFDVAYMLAGTLFYLGAAYTLKENGHVKIDFLSQRFPPTVGFVIQTLFTGVLFLPIIGVIVFSVFDKTWQAFVTQQTNYTSPWAPLMWPFYSAIGIGLLALWLQALAGLVERIMVRWRDDVAGSGPAADTTAQARTADQRDISRTNR